MMMMVVIEGKERERERDRGKKRKKSKENKEKTKKCPSTMTSASVPCSAGRRRRTDNDGGGGSWRRDKVQGRLQQGPRAKGSHLLQLQINSPVTLPNATLSGGDGPAGAQRSRTHVAAARNSTTHISKPCKVATVVGRSATLRPAQRCAGNLCRGNRTTFVVSSRHQPGHRSRRSWGRRRERSENCSQR